MEAGLNQIVLLGRRQQASGIWQLAADFLLSLHWLFFFPVCSISGCAVFPNSVEQTAQEDSS
jgi:hypothetical protein